MTTMLHVVSLYVISCRRREHMEARVSTFIGRETVKDSIAYILTQVAYRVSACASVFCITYVTWEISC